MSELQVCASAWSTVGVFLVSHLFGAISSGLVGSWGFGYLLEQVANVGMSSCLTSALGSHSNYETHTHTHTVADY